MDDIHLIAHLQRPSAGTTTVTRASIPQLRSMIPLGRRRLAIVVVGVVITRRRQHVAGVLVGPVPAAEILDRVHGAGVGVPAGAVHAGEFVDLGRAAEGGVEGRDEGFQAGDVAAADAEVGFDDGPDDEEDAVEGEIRRPEPGFGRLEAEDREGDHPGRVGSD